MGGNKQSKKSSDILPLYVDKYKICNEPPLSDDDRNDLDADMKAEQERLDALAAQNKE